MTKIIETHGSLFRLSDAAYRKLLALLIAGKKYDLSELGRFIGCIHARLDSFHREDAEFDLARMDAKRPTKASPVVGRETANRRWRTSAGRSGKGQR